jgi:hypothetical protein
MDCYPSEVGEFFIDSLESHVLYACMRGVEKRRGTEDEERKERRWRWQCEVDVRCAVVVVWWKEGGAVRGDESGPLSWYLTLWVSRRRGG